MTDKSDLQAFRDNAVEHINRAKEAKRWFELYRDGAELPPEAQAFIDGLSHEADNGNNGGVTTPSGVLTGSEAVFGFAGYLTCLHEPITISRKHDACAIANAANDFCKNNNLADPIDGWQNKLFHPEQPAQSKDDQEKDVASITNIETHNGVETKTTIATERYFDEASQSVKYRDVSAENVSVPQEHEHGGKVVVGDGLSESEQAASALDVSIAEATYTAVSLKRSDPASVTKYYENRALVFEGFTKFHEHENKVVDGDVWVTHWDGSFRALKAGEGFWKLEWLTGSGNRVSQSSTDEILYVDKLITPSPLRSEAEEVEGKEEKPKITHFVDPTFPIRPSDEALDAEVKKADDQIASGEVVRRETFEQSFSVGDVVEPDGFYLGLDQEQNNGHFVAWYKPKEAADHASDCATHNEPAMEAGECDCDEADTKPDTADSQGNDHPLTEWIMQQEWRWEGDYIQPIKIENNYVVYDDTIGSRVWLPALIAHYTPKGWERFDHPYPETSGEYEIILATGERGIVDDVFVNSTTGILFVREHKPESKDNEQDAELVPLQGEAEALESQAEAKGSLDVVEQIEALYKEEV